VPLDLGFVPHPAQGKTKELAVHGCGDGAAERGLAHARRPHQAEDGTLGALLQHLHSQKLEDPLLDLVQTEVVPVEQHRRLVDVNPVIAFFVPGSERAVSR
jgi:hypothetical protein